MLYLCNCLQYTFKLACTKVQRAIVVTLMSAPALASHFKVLRQNYFYVMGKALSGKLSGIGTGLVVCGLHS